jgi:hypothetical protein
MAMTPLPHRVRSRSALALTRVAIIGACALLAAACGSTAAPSPGTGNGSSSSASQDSAAKISLAVNFSSSPTTPARHYTLRCQPAGGTTPDAARACGRLLAGKSLFAPRSGKVMCPMILASAGRATITGVYLGQKVHETIVDGGCDLGRYAKLKRVFN